MSHDFDCSISETNQFSTIISSPEKRAATLQNQVTTDLHDPVSPLQRAKDYYLKRRLREQMFGNPDLFADPAWDMLIHLFIVSEEGREISVSGACIASAVPASTALRWLKILEDAGHIVRRHDPLDPGRMFMELSERSVIILRAYFSDNTTIS